MTLQGPAMYSAAQAKDGTDPGMTLTKNDAPRFSDGSVQQSWTP